jgi:phenylacetate-CoA ligase
MSVSPFKESEYAPTDRDDAVVSLLSHAARHSPYYRDQDWAKRLRSGRNIRFLDVPITPKLAVKQNIAAFYSKVVPASEGHVIDKFTSGSTGEPILIKKTERHFRLNFAENRRLRQGWGFERQSGMILTSSATKDHPLGSVERVGPIGSNDWMLYGREPKCAIDFLCRTRCSHISVYPSQAVSIFEMAPPLDFLKLLSTFGEVIPPELPLLSLRFPGCLHYDTYGSVETGIIAGKCRECDQYHVADRHLIMELLDENWQPVPPGVMGRVIVTPLCNMAMPILRYELGDYAVLPVERKCRVSRHAVARIVGREKNLFRLPDGSRITPMIGAKDVLALGIRKFKLIQTSQREIQVIYVAASPDIDLSAGDLQPLIDRHISPLIQASPVRVDEIKPSASGKFLMHESLVA